MRSSELKSLKFKKTEDRIRKTVDRIMHSTTEDWLLTTCNKQQATCYMRRTTDNGQWKTCNTQPATSNFKNVYPKRRFMARH